MSNWFGPLAPPKHPVLSLGAQAQAATQAREQSQFEVLVRHLLHRFFHNELLASDDETKRVMQISYTVALPGLLVAMFLFPAYHAFPPYPFPRPFWPQVGDHYFYVMYSLVLMGAATVYEWDLLFPDLLDVFVLSILPIANRRLFFARVLALAIFLALVLFGTSILGTLFLPLVAGLQNPMRHLFAHAIAVTMSGAFAATTFLALQGILLSTVGERFFRRITPLLQGGSLMLLLAVLLLYPTLAPSLQTLLLSGSPIVHSFPPFWFLGVYEYLLYGPSIPPIFGELAQTACYALLLMLAAALLTYPLAYRRRVRQLIEGASATASTNRGIAPLHRLLHATILRAPANRAMFHFISQTILRSQRHRVMLAMYAGLGVALTLANMVVLRLNGSHVRPALLSRGIRTAVPIMVFWTVIGLRGIASAPMDRRGSWLFRVLIGRPKAGHLTGVRLWITLWAASIGTGTVLILHTLSPADLQRPLVTAGQFLVAIGLSILLADLLLLNARTFPFTHLRKSSITDFPLMIFRYFILFPLFVTTVVHFEPKIEANVAHLAGALLVLIGAHILLMHVHARSLQQVTVDPTQDEADEFPQRLGLRDT
ncbi:hypothetical protein [Granulicella sp. dw_53]|uniref:hypothetical protein n=1 Tax=Granulicella sp. dw_53 TaxID=2719792 RepID=UPI001BD46AD5|nr:hypothetical protein [Granulicella sp. dw_53]